VEPVFVSRDKELARLGELFSRALEGRGQTCFITGEAGFGKTSLTLEFARRAQRTHSDLLVAVGDCNAQTGISDPYLPFREVLAMLTGDVDERVATGMTTRENANRLQEFLRISKEVITEVAPDLIGMFVPGAGLATRAGVVIADNRKRRKLEQVAAAETQTEATRAAPTSVADQGRIFEQVTAVFVELAKKRPLILVLDDLHWIDESSSALLFHLARRIDRSRILIIGTYRPEDVAVGRGDSRHPLPQVISELKSHYGDLLIVLGDETRAETRQFVDALIDAMPNRLGEAFRRELHLRTNGHALFATELLQNMRERGDLVQDETGCWVQRPSLDWKKIPARVEGVIEERIHRMRKELQDILTIASVEGETFTVQVIGRLQQVNDRQLLRTLTQELDRQHRLVSEEGNERIGATLISQFRFRHHLFHKYFYENLGVSERELLHEDVANVLEALYGEVSDKVAVQLAHHYELARLDEKAAASFLVAGRTALAMHAHSEAIALATRGIECLNRIGDVSKHAPLLLDLDLLLGAAQHRGGRFAESMETYKQTAELAASLGASEALAQAALGYDEPRWRCNLLEPVAVRLLGQALDQLERGDSVVRACLLARLARARWGAAPVEELLAQLDEAVAMARRLGDTRALLEALRTRLSLDRSPERTTERIALIDEMIAVARRNNDKQMLMELLAFRVYDCVALGDGDSWERDLSLHETLAEESEEPFWRYNIRAMRTAQALNSGRFEEAEDLAMRALETGQALGVDNVEGVMGVQLFTIRREQGRLHEIAPLVRHFVEERGAGAAWRPGLALIYADLDRLSEAQVEFDRLAERDFAAVAHDSLWQTCLCYLAEVCDRLQDTARATVLHELLRPYAEQTVVVGNATVCLGATSRFLGQLAATLSRWDLAESYFRHALELNERMRAGPWLAHSRYQYARMLLRRGANGDAARAAELTALAQDAARAFGMRNLMTRTLNGIEGTC
jgi:tetratricopeptide (TPR) repeat protein